jgi:hypothetical protein
MLVTVIKGRSRCAAGLFCFETSKIFDFVFLKEKAGKCGMLEMKIISGETIGQT